MSLAMNEHFIALVGMPNSGKSALFNSITGSHQRVANFPGITVEKKIGKLVKDNNDISVIDLPGVYSLDVTTLDEKVTRDYLFKKITDKNVDSFVVVLDSTNLHKSLYLALQIKELGQKAVVALNMYDLAVKRGQRLDLKKLEEKLAMPIIPTVAVDDEGIEELINQALTLNQGEATTNIPKDYQSRIKEPSYIKEKFAEIEKILSDITIETIKPDGLTDKIDRILLHPVLGVISLLAILVFMFQLLFSWADPVMGWVEALFELMAVGVENVVPEGFLQSLLIDGVIAGVGGVMVFLPHIVMLFLMILFLEDVGYLGRVAFLMDYLMRRFGLPGRAVVPMLSSHACAIPGIMSARIIDNPKERLITMLVAPVTTCSARLPVYVLLIAAIVPNVSVYGFSLSGLFMAGMYLFGILSAFIIALVCKKVMYKSAPSMLLMELPPYRIPRLKNILIGTYQRAMVFIKKAGTVIFALSVVLWFLVTFPKPPENATEPDIYYSAAAKIGHAFEPIFRPLGFDWKMTTALVPSFAAREVLVSAMGTVMAVEGNEEDEAFNASLTTLMKENYSIPTLLALMIWFVFSPQCVSTIGVLKRETNGWKWPLVFVGYTLALAYLMAFITYTLASFYF